MQDHDPIQSEGLIPTVSIDALLAARDNLVAALEGAGRKVEEALGHFSRFASYPPSLELSCGSERYRLTDARDADRWREEVDRAAWRHLFEVSGVSDVMSSERKRKLQGMLHGPAHRSADERIPPLTRENIAATFESVFSSVGDMFEESVEEVFRKLSWDYRTNVPCRFGRRLIVEYGCDAWPGSRTWSIRYDSSVNDLERVVCRLAGLPQPDHRSGLRGRGDMPFGEWVTGLYGEGVEPPLRVKGHRKRSLHVEIADPEVVDKLNRIIAKRYPGRVAPERKPKK